MPEWMKGLVAGVILTLIGFGLTVTWDVHKFRQEADQRDGAILAAVNEELAANLEILRVDQEQVEQELKVLGSGGQHIVAPLNLLQAGSWDLIKIGVPKKLAQERAVLIQVSRASKPPMISTRPFAAEKITEFITNHL